MTDAERLLGSPASTAVAEARVVISPRPDVDVVWNYDAPTLVDTVRAVRLRLEFSKGKLVYATSYHRDDNDQTVELFTLNVDGRFEEGRHFKEWFRP